MAHGQTTPERPDTRLTETQARTAGAHRWGGTPRQATAVPHGPYCWWVSTPGHGGYIVDRLVTMDPKVDYVFAIITFTGMLSIDGIQCFVFEEDQDWILLWLFTDLLDGHVERPSKDTLQKGWDYFKPQVIDVDSTLVPRASLELEP